MKNSILLKIKELLFSLFDIPIKCPVCGEKMLELDDKRDICNSCGNVV